MSRAANADQFNARRDSLANAAVCVGLALVTLLVFAQTSRFEFLNFDDDLFISDNAKLHQGLTARGLAWAFTANLTHHDPAAEYWEPLTLLTRLADVQFHGLAPGGHHVTSVILHLIAGLALFFAVRALLGSRAQSAVIAALFLIHPLHAEPVAWLSARKDVLNGFFYFATIWAYADYAKKTNWRRYLLVCVAFLCANMSKPMAVSLPFVLLLLDFWPLNRFRAPLRSRETAWIIAEKIPLLAIAGAVARLAMIDQRAHGAVGDESLYPLRVRLANAAMSFCAYLGQTFVPRNLAVLYPHPGTQIGVALAIAAAVGCLAITAFVLLQAKSRPWLLVGWLWFIIVLLPVSGLVQIGEMARADRYTYVALVGVFILCVRQVSEWARAWEKSSGHSATPVLSASAAIVLGALAFVAWRQTQTWHDSVSVFRQAVAVTDANYIAEADLGSALFDRGDKEEGRLHFERALEINAPALEHHRDEGRAAEERGDLDRAIYHYSKVLTLVPWDAGLHERLGGVLLRTHDYAKALFQFNETLRYERGSVAARIGVARALIGERREPEAARLLQSVVEHDPANDEARALLDSLPRDAVH